MNSAARGLLYSAFIGWLFVVLTIMAPVSATAVSTATIAVVQPPTLCMTGSMPSICGVYNDATNFSLSVYMWVVISNSQQQTTAVYLESATATSGQNVSVSAALLNLPAGTYTVNAFVTTTSGIVCSTTTSFELSL